jgi:predicted ABC-class ATPase
MDEMMAETPHPISVLPEILDTLDRQSFESYRKLQNQSFIHHRYHLRFIHIQGSSGAFPASLCHLTMDTDKLGIDAADIDNGVRAAATADFLLRAFGQAVRVHALQNRGVQGSGSYQPLELPPQVLSRNMIRFERPKRVRIAFYISLPGSHDNRILGRQAATMLGRELEAIVGALKASTAQNGRLRRHCDVVEDMVSLQSRLEDYGLVAFIGDDAILPRASGVSQAPMEQGAVAFQTPDALSVEIDLPHAGRVRGFGIRSGVTVLIGGAFHGKSTLLDALAKGVYPHIPGDGRHCMAVHPDTVYIRAEEGRAVNGVDISGFVDNLPGQDDTKVFRTQNASGSTSEAASITEAVQAGAKFLLLDEDSSASNFLIKDALMRRLIPEDPITPLFDRIRELHRRWGVSSLIAVGGSSEYLGVAHHVVAMRNFQPVSMNDAVRRLALPGPMESKGPLVMKDRRRVLSNNFDPVYHSKRLGKSIAVRIKPLRLQDRVLEYGDQQLDLTCLAALVDPHQVMAIGYALLLARHRLGQSMMSPSHLARALDQLIEKEGLDTLLCEKKPPLALARPRRLELAAAINRLRCLEVNIEAADLS